MSGELSARSGPVKRLRALLHDPKARRAERAFAVEGPRAVEAALDRGAPLEVAFFASTSRYRGRADERLQFAAI